MHSKNSWFIYKLLYMDFYPYVNLTLHTNFIYGFITYGFITYEFYIQIYYYGSKSICNYIQI